MKVLLFSKDPALFREDDGRIGDARRRHAFYAARLCERHPGSEIRIIGYTRAGERTHEVAPGLTLYPTNSRLRLLYLAGAALCLREVLADGWRPDVVSVQTPWEEGVLGLLVARLLGARFIPQLHVDIFSEEWAREHPLNRWRRFVAKRVLARAAVVRVVSESLRVRVVEHCKLPMDGVRVAPVGVDFAPAPRSRNQAGHPVVLFVGRLSPEKRLDLWLQVAQDIARDRPDARFVIVGDGRKRAELEAGARELGIGTKVAFAGAIKHSELPAVYADADVFLLTSDHEAFGRVVLEAQLSGVPVVSTDCSGPRELIATGKTGVLVARGDRSGLASAVRNLLTDPVLAAEISKRGESSARERYTLPALTDRLIDAWERA